MQGFETTRVRVSKRYREKEEGQISSTLVFHRLARYENMNFPHAQLQAQAQSQTCSSQSPPDFEMNFGSTQGLTFGDNQGQSYRDALSCLDFERNAHEPLFEQFLILKYN